VAVIGVGQTPFRSRCDEKTYPELAQDATVLAMRDANVAPEEIDAVVFSMAVSTPAMRRSSRSNSLVSRLTISPEGLIPTIRYLPRLARRPPTLLLGRIFHRPISFQPFRIRARILAG